MGGSAYSHDDYAARSSVRAAAGKTGFKAFDHDVDIKAGKTEAKVHKTLDPKGVKIRESRDSDTHPVSLPIGVILDTTGSMGEVPVIIQGALPKLMGGFLDDKASGKKYLGDAYPAILIGAVDDFYAQSHYDGNGALQVGQFESGIEIDDNLTNLWITQNGGGTYEESYDLALYFFARHTAHDHWDKRHKKGYLFLIGDEHLYPSVDKTAVLKIIGDHLQDNIPAEDILKEAKKQYHVFFIIPNLSHHYHDTSLERYWVNLLGQQHVLKLEDPRKICEMIVSAVAISEHHAKMEDLTEDGIVDGAMSKALAVLATERGIAVNVEGLPPVSGAAGASRL